MGKNETFAIKISWKAVHFDIKTRNDDSRERYGLKTKYRKKVKELIPYKNNLVSLLEVIRFRQICNQFNKIEERC